MVSRVFLVLSVALLAASFRWPYDRVGRHASSLVTMAAAEDGGGELQSALSKALKLHQSGALEPALAAYDEFIAKVPEGSLDAAASTLGTVFSNKGSIFMNLGQSESAKVAFQDAVRANPEDASAHYNLAIVLTSKLKDHRKALRHARIASKLDEKNPSVLHLIANILQSMGATDEAGRYFDMAEVYSLGEVASGEGGAEGKGVEGMEWGSLTSRPLATAKVGDTFTLQDGNSREIKMTCVSAGTPLVFHIKGLVSVEESEEVISKAVPSMEESFVMGGAGEEAYRSSENTWLAPYSMPLLKDIQARLAGLTGFDLGGLVSAAEELQVIRYQEGGQFKPHHDSTGFKPRLFTALIYLNDLEEVQEGGTWFPYASGSGTIAPLDVVSSLQEAIDASLRVNKEEVHAVGLTIQPHVGDCVLFFNHLPGDGTIDITAVHAGLPLKGSKPKWAANYWYGPLDK
jgi:hypothetical protein